MEVSLNQDMKDYIHQDESSWPEGPQVEHFTLDERQFLKSFVSNTDRPVFALVNMPEVVKGALFARYSRSSKSLRRLLLDEFKDDLPRPNPDDTHRPDAAEGLYERVFGEFGDDSIAQLGAVHIACEGISNVATKLLERGRLMSYLEQSTRYVPYTDKPYGRWKYHTPAELAGSDSDRFDRTMDAAFRTYAETVTRVAVHIARIEPRSEGLSEAAYRRAVRAKALDVARALLPAATRSNVGIFGSGQAYEMLVMRLRASGNQEARAISDLMLTELQKVIPAFVARVPREDRGVAWTKYLDDRREQLDQVSDELTQSIVPDSGPEVSLIDFDPQGETKVVAAALYASSHLSEHQLWRLAEKMSEADRSRVLRAYIGDRLNRRHRPGRAFERTSYRFEVLGEYGAFRDMQRHRLLSLDWQTLSSQHGYETPDVVEESGSSGDWHEVMARGAELHSTLARNYSNLVASYAVPMAYRIRYFMDMNAREAMHVIELRSSAQGHDNYRRVALKMHEQIHRVAGHRSIADAMKFVDTSGNLLGRLDAEIATDSREHDRLP